MPRILKTILTVLIVLHTCSFYIFAQTRMDIQLVPNISSPVQGEDVTVNFSFESPEESNIATFRAVVSFDSSKLKYTGIYSNFGTEDFKTNLVGDVLTVIYLTGETGVYIDPHSPVDFFELDFKVLSTAGQGATQVSAQIDGMGNYDAEAFLISPIKGANIDISTSPVANCDLYSLSAEEYKLVPAFSPDITKYTVDVPYDVSTLEVTAEPSESDATVKVSRKTLNSFGKTTDIKVTVTGVDQKSKKIYTITVKRATKDSVSSQKSSSSKGSQSSSFSSKKNSGLVDGNGLLSSGPGVSLVKSNFNFTLFFIVMAVCTAAAIFIIKKNDK